MNIIKKNNCYSKKVRKSRKTNSYLVNNNENNDEKNINKGEDNNANFFKNKLSSNINSITIKSPTLIINYNKEPNNNEDLNNMILTKNKSKKIDKNTKVLSLKNAISKK